MCLETSLGFPPSLGPPPCHPAPPRSPSASVPPLQATKLLENPFLRELVLRLGRDSFSSLKGLKVAQRLDKTHPAKVLGTVDLRPTFVDMFRSFLDFGILVSVGEHRVRVHPDLVDGLAALSLRTCLACEAYVTVGKDDCWMCEANHEIAHIVDGFRGVQQLTTPNVLDQAVFVPPEGLSATEASVGRLVIPAGSLLATAPLAGGYMARYYRIFPDSGDEYYLRVTRVGRRDLWSRMTAVEVFAEVPAIAPGFISWHEFLYDTATVT